MKEQGDHDKSFPILDCTQRLKGYTYVMGIDMDEVLMPAKHDNIKDFAKEMFTVRTMSRSCNVHLYSELNSMHILSVAFRHLPPDSARICLHH